MQRVGTLLSGFLAQVSADEELSLVFLSELWPQIVGKEVAEKARPVALRKKRLVVRVSSELWKKQLDELRQVLVESINRFWNCPLVETIELRIRLE